MKKILFVALMLLSCTTINSFAQEVKSGRTTTNLARPYNEDIDAMQQIKQACAQAKAENKNVICQVGGNWCKWCLWFADFVSHDADIAKVINDNYVYIHVNYSPKNKNEKAMKFFGNPGLGYPFFVVLNADCDIQRVQESVCMEDGEGYSKEKVLEFLNRWVPEK